MEGTIKVEGLDELRRQMKAAGPNVPREISKAHKHVAGIVGEEARDRMADLGVPRSSIAAQGIAWSGTQTAASIVLQASNPFVRAVEYGTEVHYVYGRPVKASTMARRVFREWAGAGEEAGYAAWPAIRDFLEGEEIERVYSEAILDAYARAFPDRIA